MYAFPSSSQKGQGSIQPFPSQMGFSSLHGPTGSAAVVTKMPSSGRGTKT